MIMNFYDMLTKLRRYLRDPDGLIWDVEQLRIYWDDAQIEVAQKINYIERAHSYRYPPSYTWSYMRDWEYQYTDGDKIQCLSMWDQGRMVICYPWESVYWMTSSQTPDDGYRFTHPFESVYGSPADVVKMPLHAQFISSKYVAWDEETITPQEERIIARNDPFYKTRSGSPVSFYLPDKEHNQVVLYPRPSSTTWSEDDRRVSESTGLDDTGGLEVYTEDEYDETDYGLIIETIETSGHLFMVFTSMPDPISMDYEDPLDTWWPQYMLKTIAYAVLERSYGANTDGFIPSLRDYWKMRKDISIKAIKEFKSMKQQDRDYRLGGFTSKSQRSRLRLPSGYPASWP